MTFIAPHYWKKKKKAAFGFLKRDLYLVKTPWWLQGLYPNCTWNMPAGNRTLYLTFDDGPHPEITPFVLDTLRRHNAKASFFCIGNNVKQYPDIYRRILEEGHSVGNHTFSHLNGWHTPVDDYIKDVCDAEPYIQSRLFRPPYGRIKKKQIAALREREAPMQIIMWDVLSGDWEPHLTPEKCLKQVNRSIRDGSIIVFHDSEKAFPRMSYALPRVLERFAEEGYTFEKL